MAHSSRLGLRSQQSSPLAVRPSGRGTARCSRWPCRQEVGRNLSSPGAIAWPIPPWPQPHAFAPAPATAAAGFGGRFVLSEGAGPPGSGATDPLPARRGREGGLHSPPSRRSPCPLTQLSPFCVPSSTPRKTYKKGHGHRQAEAWENFENSSEWKAAPLKFGEPGSFCSAQDPGAPLRRQPPGGCPTAGPGGRPASTART